MSAFFRRVIAGGTHWWRYWGRSSGQFSPASNSEVRRRPLSHRVYTISHNERQYMRPQDSDNINDGLEDSRLGTRIFFLQKCFGLLRIWTPALGKHNNSVFGYGFLQWCILASQRVAKGWDKCRVLASTISLGVDIWFGGSDCNADGSRESAVVYLSCWRKKVNAVL